MLRPRMFDCEDGPPLTVASLQGWQLAATANALAIGAIGFAASIALGAKPGHALHALIWGAIWFGGLMFIFSLLVSSETSPIPAVRRRTRDLELLPPSAKIVRPLALIARGWRSDAILVAVFAVVYVTDGPTRVAFLSGYGLGAGVGAIPLHLLAAWRGRTSRRELFIEVRSALRLGKRLYERRLA